MGNNSFGGLTVLLIISFVIRTNFIELSKLIFIKISSFEFLPIIQIETFLDGLTELVMKPFVIRANFCNDYRTIKANKDVEDDA